MVNFKDNEKFDKWIKYLLRNEQRIKSRLNLYLLTERESSESETMLSQQKTGRETENKVVGKITNKDYLFKSECLKCVEDLYDEMNPLNYDVMMLRFRLGYKIDRVCREVNYSKSAVNNIIRSEKDKLKAKITLIESK